MLKQKFRKNKWKIGIKKKKKEKQEKSSLVQNGIKKP